MQLTNIELLDFQDIKNKRKTIQDVPKSYIEYIKGIPGNSSCYPRYHIAPKHGLMNDPNGLIEIDGWYHIFYQWFPLGPVHGLKHWYHVKTRDFVHYIDLGIGMEPDSIIDRNGCYSGMMEKTDRNTIYYTGVNEENEQNVCIAEFDKAERIINKEVLIPLDKNVTTRNFRDPYVFEKKGIKYMIVGAELVNGKGAFLLYKKEKGQFIPQGPLNIGEVDLGYMLECPNMITIDGKDILIFSPQGIESPDKYTYRNVFSVAYGIGEMNGEQSSFSCDTYIELDKGFDFYAPQIFQDSKQRTIMLAWLGNSKCVYPSDCEQWAHMMTLPRELSVKNNQLYQWPLEELELLRTVANPIQEDMNIENQCLEIVLEVGEEFLVSLENEMEETVTFIGNSDEYILDRSQMSALYNEDYGNIRYAKREKAEWNIKKEQIRIYIDHSCIEIFAGNGSITFTSRFYLSEFNRIKFRQCQGTLYYLKEIES